jgi:hypothetical protein
MELGILNIYGLNEACEIAVEQNLNIRCILSPNYESNNNRLTCGKLLGTYGVNVQDVERIVKAIIDINDSYKTRIVNVLVQNKD